uniref:Uncharacterized protein n=1 Tax=Mycena chlorophos TaxID=658473 RepID=A0ABQ0LB06_MYCCL|nr:predicted protein [Mycena chlorophos]
MTSPLMWDTRDLVGTTLTLATHPYLFRVFNNVVASFSAPGSASQTFMVELLENSAKDGVTGKNIFDLFIAQLRSSPPPIRFVDQKKSLASINASDLDAKPPNHWYGKPFGERWSLLDFPISLDLLHKIEEYSATSDVKGVAETLQALYAFFGWTLGHEFAHIAQAAFGNQPTSDVLFGLEAGWEWERRNGGEMSLCFTGRDYVEGVITGLAFETEENEIHYISLTSPLLPRLASANWSGLAAYLKNCPTEAPFEIHGRVRSHPEVRRARDDYSATNTASTNVPPHLAELIGNEDAKNVDVGSQVVVDVDGGSGDHAVARLQLVPPADSEIVHRVRLECGRHLRR